MDASDSARCAGPSVAVLTAASRSSVASAAPVGRSPVSHPHAQILTGLPDFSHTPPRAVDNRGSQAVDKLAGRLTGPLPGPLTARLTENQPINPAYRSYLLLV
ncbi:hypothetical protein GCM10018789_53550 [Streptomyces werraensis]|nr:hypothetical protein GCM10018789_53550 [Streptomyces werraensis]